MKKEMKLRILLIVFSLFLLAPAFTLEKTITLGRGDNWQDLITREYLDYKSGRWGSLDLVLEDFEYQPSNKTDLLLHFNLYPVADAAGFYRLKENNIILSEEVKRYGRAGGGFTGRDRGISLSPLAGALFKEGNFWDDFTIEFWLYPMLLNDGEIIISWEGFEWGADSRRPQSMRVVVRSRKLHWEFDNFFISADRELISYNLSGITHLLPKIWHHHLLRFDSSSGMVEYLVDGIPEAVLYTTEKGGNRDDIALPHIGRGSDGLFTIGKNYTGFLDELRISREFVKNTGLTRYRSSSGRAVSRVFDLEYTGTSIKRIESIFQRPGNSAVNFYYKASDYFERRNRLETPWQQFEPGSELSGVRGRYIQVMVELFPDGLKEVTPEVSDIRLIYEPDLPPAPPSGLYGVAGNGKATLHWKSVFGEDVSGYLVYYGDYPGHYLGEGSDQGESPIDAGDATQLEITGLKNNRLYYFAVVAYDSTEPPHRSLFSREISLRPSWLFK